MLRSEWILLCFTLHCWAVSGVVTLLAPKLALVEFGAFSVLGRFVCAGAKNEGGQPGVDVFNAIVNAAKRGIKIRVVAVRAFRWVWCVDCRCPGLCVC